MTPTTGVPLRSFAKYYWAAWFTWLALYFLSTTVVTPAKAIGGFAFFAGLGSVYVLHFEFGRLMGFLRTYCPSQHAELQSKPFIEAIAFVHPSLIRRFWQPRQTPPLAEDSALLVYRSAWLSSFLSLVFLLVLANTVQ
ncbi:MAG: hypothetical protein ACK5D9_01435 [Burkholderiales bacterium]